MKKYYIIICLSLFIFSCEKYVDILPKGNTIPTNVDDLAELMNISGSDGSSGTKIQVSTLNTLSMIDDIKYVENGFVGVFSQQPLSTQKAYIWAPYLYTINENDDDWNKLYSSNYLLNYIIENVENASQGRIYDRNDVKGRALFHRAMNYFILANEYSKQYKESTATNDLSVPLVLESNINKSHPRSKVKEVYNSIISDLTESIKLLKNDYDQFNHIPGKAAAFALLSRVYLFMGKYQESYDNSVEALSRKSAVIDYNRLSFVVPYMGAYGGLNNYYENIYTNEEILYEREYIGYRDYLMTDDLLGIFDRVSDLRYRYMTVDLSIFGLSGILAFSSNMSSNIMTSEIWLTKAECALRVQNPNISEALNALNYVRIRRIDKNLYTPVTETNKDKLLKLILEERRRETRMSYMRWFDLKRLNLDPSTAKTITRSIGGNVYTLTPESPLYVLPIPLNVLQFDNIPQNPAPGRN
ncbi:MAG: RagB/SusD family nutrient uptake outer membrane protein [Bacteroidales bacterium]|jgi:hypothetical protein